MTEAKRFPTACVASPHHLASSAGLAMLASGGNALDAAVATNLTLAAVTPYLCGLGGDLFAMVWDGSSLHGYDGSGRAPAAATVDRVREACGSSMMPSIGPLTVTVPGAVEAWFTILERFGSRPFAELAAPALRYARDGFTLTRAAAAAVDRFKLLYAQDGEWHAVYGGAAAGARLCQHGLARTIEALCARGPEACYHGEVAEAIAGCVDLMTPEDLAGHGGEWVEPLRSTYRSVEVAEMPPPSQGVTALEALNIVEGLDLDAGREHLMIEAVKVALSDRGAYVTDPGHMTISAHDLASKEWAAGRRPLIDPERAGAPVMGSAAPGGTAYVCAADGNGMSVSLIQSNYLGFGSGVTVPGWGINLQNRGSFFSLDPLHPNAIAPRKRTMHTLAPAMAFKDGRPWLVFGTMGGDGQTQTHLQLLVRIIDDGADVQRAIDAPRWLVSPADWSVTAEPRFADAVLDGLRARGHRVATCRPYDSTMGHAHTILMGAGGYAGATDPRAEGAVLGC